MLPYEYLLQIFSDATQSFLRCTSDSHICSVNRNHLQVHNSYIRS